MFDNIKIVLVGTTHPGNIGATARAMKTMGLTQLVLVAPKFFPHDEATAMASGADDLLKACQVVENLNEAVADCQYVFGTTARARDLDWPMYTPSDLAEQCKEHVSYGASIAIVFGRERTGLTNEELWLCQGGVMIPTSSVYRSLNLAQAVQIIAYELQLKLGSGLDVLGQEKDVVSNEAMEQFYKHLETVLIEIEFIHPSKPKRLLPKLRRLFNRSAIESSEMNILRGILTQIQKYGHKV